MTTLGAATRAALLALAGSAVLGPPAEAIPAFARKYETSCQTCHSVFPKLNAFGEAFRFRGYRMPKETEEMVKEKPTSLGSPAYKKLWPQAIWPGEISSHAPIAVVLKFADINTSSLNPDGTTSTVKNDFQFPQELNLFGAGTLGDHLSVYSEVTFAVNPDYSVSTEVEHAHLGIDSPFGPEDLFHFRIGRVNPNVGEFFVETMKESDAAIDTIFNYNPIGINGGTGLGADAVTPTPISIPTKAPAFEVYGIASHRLFYTAGVMGGISAGNGQFGNNSKDVYARVDYKFGGMGFDGDMGGREAPDKNWRDDSFRIGAFAYRGNASGVNFPTTTPAGNMVNIQDDHFWRLGGFASVFLADLNVFGVYLTGKDTLKQFDTTSGALLSQIEPDYHAFFLEADYVFYPWLHGAARYEELTPADRSVPSIRTGTFTVSALVRANVKAMLEYQRDLREGTNHSLNAILRMAF
jgi:hypothetical protein